MKARWSFVCGEAAARGGGGCAALWGGMVEG